MSKWQNRDESTKIKEGFCKKIDGIDGVYYLTDVGSQYFIDSNGLYYQIVEQDDDSHLNQDQDLNLKLSPIYYRSISPGVRKMMEDIYTKRTKINIADKYKNGKCDALIDKFHRNTDYDQFTLKPVKLRKLSDIDEEIKKQIEESPATLGTLYQYNAEIFIDNSGIIKALDKFAADHKAVNSPAIKFILMDGVNLSQSYDFYLYAYTAIDRHRLTGDFSYAKSFMLPVGLNIHRPINPSTITHTQYTGVSKPDPVIRSDFFKYNSSAKTLSDAEQSTNFIKQLIMALDQQITSHIAEFTPVYIMTCRPSEGKPLMEYLSPNVIALYPPCRSRKQPCYTRYPFFDETDDNVLIILYLYLSQCIKSREFPRHSDVCISSYDQFQWFTESVNWIPTKKLLLLPDSVKF